MEPFFRVYQANTLQAASDAIWAHRYRRCTHNIDDPFQHAPLQLIYAGTGDMVKCFIPSTSIFCLVCICIIYVLYNNNIIASNLYTILNATTYLPNVDHPAKHSFV
jgi:hypothetical protein